MKAAVSLKNRQNMIERVRPFAESIVDFSLADKVNFVSESQIRSLLSEYLTQDTRFQTAKRGRSTEFRVGWVD
jgi:hypothetical protein